MKTRSLSKHAQVQPRKIVLGTCKLSLDVPRIMGIVNNTPDCFSGDGLGGNVTVAIAKGEQLFEEGADVVDVGGESTRPGARPVSLELEISRTIPVVEALSQSHAGRVSIDTRKPEVAEAALFAGASVVNDVSGLRNPMMTEVVAEHNASVVIMHMRGEPKTMQINPRYADVVRDIHTFLSERIAEAVERGVSPRKIMVDPGIGFGKTLEHNLQIIARLGELKDLGKPIVIGLSRKGFIGTISGAQRDQRVPGSMAAALVAVQNGANMVRVHDVRETVQALKVFWAIQSAKRGQRVRTP